MYEYKVKDVVKVVDGDTIDILIDLGFGLTKKERVRVAGIDTPESRTRNLVEKQYGIAAKVYLEGILRNAEEIRVETSKDGKYGRMLGWIYVDGVEKSVNQTMIDEGYAWPYDGGTKNEFDRDKHKLDAKRKSI